MSDGAAAGGGARRGQVFRAGPFEFPKQCVGFLALLAALLVALNLYAPAGPTPVQRVLGVLLTLLCAWPLVLWFAGRECGRPLLPFYGLAYAAAFASPVFMRDAFYGRFARFDGGSFPVFSESQITGGLVVAIIGWVCFLVGFSALQRRSLTRRVPPLRAHWGDDPGVLKGLAVTLGAIGILAFVVDAAVITLGYYVDGIQYSVWIRFPVRFASGLSLLAIALLSLLSWRGDLGRAGKVFLWGGLLVPSVLLGIATGLVIRILEPVLAMLFAYAASRSVRPWPMLLACGAAAAVIVLVLLPIRKDFRVRVWSDPTAVQLQAESEIELTDAAQSIFDRLANSRAYAELMAEYVRDRGNTRYERVLDAAAFRFDQLGLLVHVMDLTPEAVPHQWGATYANVHIVRLGLALTGRTPRAATARALARAYRLVPPGRVTENHLIHPLVEFFINFGKAGIPVGMFLLGILYSVTQRAFIYPGAAVLPTAAFVPILVALVLRSDAIVYTSWGSMFVLAYAVFLGTLAVAVPAVVRVVRVVGERRRTQSG